MIDRQDGAKLVGIVSLEDLLQARVRNLHKKRARERVLRVRLSIRQRGSAKREVPLPAE